MKRVIAYGSVGHMGMLMLGLLSQTKIGIAGSLFMMVSHGIISGGLFIIIGYIYDRAKTKEIMHFSGLFEVMPVASFAFLILLLGNLGLPLT